MVCVQFPGNASAAGSGCRGHDLVAQPERLCQEHGESYLRWLVGKVCTSCEWFVHPVSSVQFVL